MHSLVTRIKDRCKAKLTPAVIDISTLVAAIIFIGWVIEYSLHRHF
jgi:hypothetical protein